ncbi:MAG: tripartite tricarboxylate transporter substrate binding protein [Burkholderiales bacterium]|nr:tripartite tricarboxylate transporter substrate binding protein [Burkholderiales bacterium]
MSLADVARTVLLFGCLHTAHVAAQVPESFPNRPIRFIVPSSPGAGSDITARMIAQHLGQAWGRQVIVDNRAGASGVIGFDIVTKAIPDGYTILLASANHPVNKLTLANFPFDLTKDVTAVSQATSLSYIAYCHPSVPVNTFQDLIAYGVKYPGKLNFGSPGNASTQHLGWELVMHKTGARFTHVPYKGGAPAIQATLGGQLQFGLITLISMRPHIGAGRLRPLAVTSRQRMAALPDLPTIAEAGVPGFELVQWYGVVTTANVAPAIVAKLGAGIADAVKSPEVARRLTADGSTPVGSTPEQFAETIRADIAKWSKLIKDIGLVVQ